MNKPQSLAEALEAWADGPVLHSVPGGTWEDFDALVTSVRELEASKSVRCDCTGENGFAFSYHKKGCPAMYTPANSTALEEAEEAREEQGELLTRALDQFDACKRERDAFAKVAADAQEQLAKALEREQAFLDGIAAVTSRTCVAAIARRKALEECLALQEAHAHEGWYIIRDRIAALLDACKEKT